MNEKKWKTSTKQKNHTIDPCHVIETDVYPGISSFVQGFLEITILNFVLVDMGSTREEKLIKRKIRDRFVSLWYTNNRNFPSGY